MNYRIYLLLFFVFVNFHAQAQQIPPHGQLSFEESLQILKANNHLLKQYGFLQKEKLAEAQARKGLFMPRVGLTGTYTAMQKDITLDLTSVRDAITPLYGALSKYGNFSGVPNPDPATNTAVPILPDNLSTKAVREQLGQGLQKVQQANWDPVIQDKMFGGIFASAIMPIYTGGKIKAANAAAKIEMKEADETVTQKSNELMSELAERYYGLCLAQQAVKVRKDVVNGMNRHLQDALKLEKEGLIAHAEVLNAQVYQSQADRELKKAEQTVHILNQALLNTLGIEQPQTIIPTSDLFYLADLEPVNYFKQAANNHSPLLAQVRTKMELAEQGLKVEKSEWLPSVAIQGTYNVIDHNIAHITPTWMAGVAAKWTLFDGGSRNKKIKAAGFKIDQVKEAEQKVQSDINTVIDKLYSTLIMYKDQIASLQSSQKFAEEYVRVREKGFREDMNSSTEVVDAQLALSKVRIERLEAMYGFDKTLADLLQFAGLSNQYSSYRLRPQVIIEKY